MKIAKESTHATFSLRSRKALALAILAMLCATSAFAAANAATGAPVSVARATRLQSGDALLGALPMNQPIHIEVALKLRNKNVLDAFIANIAKSEARRQRPQLLTSQQFLANHAPTQAQAQKVADYLVGMGYTHIVVAPNRLLVSADGTAATARNAFMTTLAQVRTHDGRIAYANTDDVRIPGALGGIVQAVIGLQDLHQFHTFDQLPSSDVSVQAGSTNAHKPTDFPWIYGVTDPVAQQIKVGILTNGNVSQVQTALNTFAASNGMQPVVQSVVGQGSNWNDTSHVGLWELDSQAIVGMINGGPGANTGPAASLIFYNIQNFVDGNVTGGLNNFVAANQAKILEASIGQCETDAGGSGTAEAQDAIFEEGMAQGQTFVIPAGDGVAPDGADQCPSGLPGNTTPSWPAASQYVTAVAGTSLNTTTSFTGQPKYNFETVWNRTGGSPSTFEPMPSWQSTFGVSGTTRGVPDVAFAADQGALIVNAGGTLVTRNGTSLSASLFAGAWARVLSAWGAGTGPASPIVYGLPTADFHDVKSGNNGGETAATGYDFASGRGSMNIAPVITDTGPLANKRPTASFQVSQPYKLTLSFQDASTDSDGTVAAHHWDFGDGSTSTQVNPTHLYAAGGTYTIVETVTDNEGATGQSSQQSTIAAADQLLGNPGIENVVAPWVYANGAFFTNGDVKNYPPFDGASVAYLSDLMGVNTTVSQQVAIPAGKTKATLSFYLWVREDNLDFPPTTDTDDVMKVRVMKPDGTLLKVLHGFSTLDGDQTCSPCAPDYVHHSYDMTPWIGQTVVVQFFANQYSPNHHRWTGFLVDDVTLTAQ